METFFYVIGGVLVLLALVISAIGIRNDDFPSTAMMRVGVLLVALVVGVTAYAAVNASEDEQGKRLEEENLAADAAEAEQTAENDAVAGQGTPQAEQSGADGSGQGPTGSSVDADGEQVFIDNGCGSCHTLAAQSQALGQIGPNLDEALVDKDAAYIQTSIMDPSAVIAEGFGDGIMPSDFGTQIAPADLDALVLYLQDSTSGSSK